jgi:MOSC domain-containing protein YiiM
LPCFKLGIRFGRPDIVKRFLRSGRSGFYLAVLEEGQIAVGGLIEVLTRDEHGVTVADIVNLYQADATNQELLRKASDLPAFLRIGATTFANVSGTRMVEFLLAPLRRLALQELVVEATERQRVPD